MDKRVQEKNNGKTIEKEKAALSQIRYKGRDQIQKTYSSRNKRNRDNQEGQDKIDKYFGCQEILPHSTQGAVECPRQVGMQDNLIIVRNTNPGECVNTFVPKFQQGIRNIRKPSRFTTPCYHRNVVKFQQA